MQHLKDYDADLKQFRGTPKAAELNRLRFLRWLADQERLEHPPAGPPTGEWAEYADTPPVLVGMD